MKITEKNGIVKWEDDGKPLEIWGQSPIQRHDRVEKWFRVRGKWFHVIKANGGCCYVNGKLFPEPTPYNERMKSIGWDFYEEVLFVMENEADKIHVDVYCKPHKPIEYITLNLEVKKLEPKERKLKEDYVMKTDADGTTWIMPAKNVNLLPKEPTMKTRYAVVNLREKVEFEKKWEMPYGYNNSPKICYEQQEAIGWINRNLGPNERREYVVERHNAGKVEVVWKIVPGQTISGEQEDDLDEDF